MKKLVIPKKKEYVLEELKQGADAFLFGIKTLLFTLNILILYKN